MIMKMFLESNDNILLEGALCMTLPYMKDHNNGEPANVNHRQLFGILGPSQFDAAPGVYQQLLADQQPCHPLYPELISNS